MNTSNKILAVFFLLVFLIPVFVLLSFKNKIKSGDFTVEKNEHFGGGDLKTGSFKAYKVVKLVAPPGRVLKCNLQYSDSLFYSYSANHSQDSIRVYNLADTLFIQYMSNTSSKDNTVVYEGVDLYIDVQLPGLEQLVVNNAEATIQSESKGTGKALNVELYGTAILNLGEGGDNEDTTVIKTPVSFDQLSVRSTGGELAVGSNVNIRQLILQADGASTINIKPGAVISDVQGSLSDSSTVNANWKYLKKLMEPGKK